MDCSLPGSSVHGIFQARVPEWVAISFSRDLPHSGIELRSPTLPADALSSEPPGKPLGDNKHLRSGFMVSACDELGHWEISKICFFFFLPLFCLFVLQLYWKEGHIAMLTTVIQCFCTYFWPITKGIKLDTGGRSQDGGGIGRGGHFLFYKFIERTTERWAKFTKQLLIASSGHQVPRKAAHCLRREVGQKY